MSFFESLIFLVDILFNLIEVFLMYVFNQNHVTNFQF
jgi:hypothetical protein